MRIVVTGGAGLTGSYVVQELVSHGYDVVCIDVVPPKEAVPAYKLVDCTDIGQVYGATAGADAIVHLAAIPRPTYHTPEQVFRINIMATFNVFEVAATLGIKTIVYVSSVSVLGVPFFHTVFSPAYVPIDEHHPKAPEDAYGLSKFFGEVMADAYVCRCTGSLRVVSLRFPWIQTPESFGEQLRPHWDDPSFGATNLWSYIDARDAARVCRLAVEADTSGHEPFFVSAADSFMNQETAPLVQAYYPKAAVKAGFSGNRSLFDFSKATRELGFAPQFSWSDYGLET